MKTGSYLLRQFFVYDFTKTGGAIGSQNTGVQLPNGVIITRLYGIIDVALADSGGGANVSIGTITNPVLICSSLGILPLAPGLIPVVPGAGINEPIGVLMDKSLNVIIDITIDIITAGKFTCYLEYFFPQ